jgi:hypothetical protein
MLVHAAGAIVANRREGGAVTMDQSGDEARVLPREGRAALAFMRAVVPESVRPDHSTGDFAIIG